MRIRATDLLTEQAFHLLSVSATQSFAEGLRREYQSFGVVQAGSFLLPDQVRRLGAEIYDKFAPFALRTEKPPQIVPLDKNNLVSAGLRFGRLDPGFPYLPPEAREALKEKFAQTGLESFGQELGEMATPLIQYLTGKAHSYQRIYCFLYEEGDYIGLHNDAQTGERVNLQLPISLDAAAGFRILHNGSFRLYTDTPGCLRILGRDVWHEVLPLLRKDESVSPRRVLISLRYR